MPEEKQVKISRAVFGAIVALGAVVDGVLSVPVESLEALVSATRERRESDELRGMISRLLQEAGIDDPNVSALVCPARMILGHGLPPSAIRSRGYWTSGGSAAAGIILDEFGLVPTYAVSVDKATGASLATVTFHRPEGRWANTLDKLRKDAADQREAAKAAKEAAKAAKAAKGADTSADADTDADVDALGEE